MKTLKEKTLKVMSGIKTYRLLELESTDKGFSEGQRYLVDSNGTLVGGFKDNLIKAEKYFDNTSSITNWL